MKLKKEAKLAVTLNIETFDEFNNFEHARFKPRKTFANVQNELLSVRQDGSVSQHLSKTSLQRWQNCKLSSQVKSFADRVSMAVKAEIGIASATLSDSDVKEA